MEQSGEHHIPAPRQAVWEALNDPEVLAACLDGCESIERVSDEEFDAAVKAKVGPVSASFKAKITLHDIDAPNGYRLQVDVKGGAAGFGKGTAKVALSDAGAGTLLSYDVKATVGGKLAQVGSRLIDGVARKMSESFFTQFVERLGGGEAQAPSDEAADEGASVQAAASETKSRWPIWAAVIVLLILGIALAL